ncbi:MAG: nucleotidyl transferase AbiEii/AbiGii toxin family protein [Kiritimatiellae bacterium]|nr:nucleotidyl transferase AbiEii/AbiGii toxin family protein [Kiritimatiellia bacterium]
MEVQPDFKELLELLNKYNVKYLIVGGYALAFHGAPRFTGDIDVFVCPDEENEKRILKALSKFGFQFSNLYWQA